MELKLHCTFLLALRMHKLQLKEKEAMRYVRYIRCEFFKAEIPRECGEPMTDLGGFLS